MRLAGIWIVWDDYELLYHSFNAIRSVVDEVIVIASETSTMGEKSPIPQQYMNPALLSGLHKYEPQAGLSQRDNERNKRNYGLKKAREAGCTHFLMLDADEYYDPQAIQEAKEEFNDPTLNGLVCASKIYIRSPELCTDDFTRVPFIHKLTPELQFKKNYEYPFSCGYHGILIDPTRTLNITEGVKMSHSIMHHMTLVRRDVKKKIRNSSGEKIKQFSELLILDYVKAKEGYRLRYYNIGEGEKDRILERVPNTFNIPLIEDTALLGSIPSVADDR